MTPTRTFAAGVTLALGSLLVATGARADDPPPVSVVHEYSPYERESIDEALAESGRSIDPNPEGKTIESIDIRPLEVIEKRDPAPRFVNWFHATSRPYVIEREVLLKVGDPYRSVLVDESARNLRTLFQLTLVLCVPVRGTTPGRVRLLVITKDLWSLRLQNDFTFINGRFEYLFLQPIEVNLFGTHDTVGAQFVLRPNSYTFGLSYGVPWLFGQRIAARAEANVIVHRPDYKTEGSYGGVSIGSPLYSTRTEWAWGGSATWQEDVFRRYVNAQLGSFRARAPLDEYSNPYELGRYRIPFEFRRSIDLGTLSAIRSFGWARKNDVSFGVEASRRIYRTLDLSAYAPSAVEQFQSTVLPISDTRVGPFLEHRAYTTDFLRVLDVEVLGLQEDYRLGYDIDTKIYPVLKSLGSTRDLLGFRLGAQYTLRLGDGFARGNVITTIEAERDAIADGRVSSRLRIVSPRTGIGRLVFDGEVLHRFRNHLNSLTYLGGESRLRGYPSSYVFGKDMVGYSLEFRSRPVQILAVQIGAVAFYDTGDAFDGFGAMNLKHSVGGGLRFLFPQLDKVVFRGDIGFPIEPHGLPPGVSAFNVIIAAEQAFGSVGVTPSSQQGASTSAQ